MNPLYPSPKVNTSLPYALKLITVVLFTTVLCFTGTQTFSQQNLVFQNPVLESGSSCQDGAIYRFPGVTTGVDAIVKVKGRSSSDVVLQNIDVTDVGCNKAFQPQVGRTGNVSGITDWWMDFAVEFVRAGTSLPVNVFNFDVTAFDVDGDDLIVREYVEFYKAKSASVQALTQLLLTPLSPGNNINENDYRLTGPFLHLLNIDTATTALMGTAKYEARNKMEMRVGAKTTGLGISNDGMRYNSFWFGGFTHRVAGPLPIKLTSFDVSLINKKITASWTSSAELNASHYVVQRSTDGVEFTNAGIVFTEGNSTTTRSYSFRDPISTNTKGVIYYRLKMVDTDGAFELSAIRLVKLGESDGKLELQAFPNPVVREVRITIPESWQNKQVVYELYTTDGQLLKRFLNKSATQTEVINMEYYQPGSYVVKALNDKEMASQRIIKRR